jgi:hypothetical protein
MAKFVEFQDNNPPSPPVIINTDHILTVRPHPSNPNISMLSLVGGVQFGVMGKLDEVVKKLSAD